MTYKRKLDSFGGVHSFFEHDWLTGESIISHVEDVEPTLERAKALQNDPEVWAHGVKQGFAYYATIPTTIYMKWRKEGIDLFNKDHTQAVLKKLNHPDYQYLRMTTKKHF